MKKAAVKQPRSNGAKAGRTDKGRFEKENRIGFQPGQSGNPAGRPKTITLSEAYRAALARPFPDDPQERTYAEVIAEQMVIAAVAGEVSQARELADRTEGKPRQMLDVDMNLLDWRELASKHGLNLQDVLNEARHIIESAAVAGGQESDREDSTD